MLADNLSDLKAQVAANQRYGLIIRDKVYLHIKYKIGQDPKDIHLFLAILR